MKDFRVFHKPQTMERFNQMNNPATPFFIKIPKSGPAPLMMGTCATCAKWQEHEAQRMAQTQQGSVTIAALIKAGMAMPRADEIMTVAQCTDQPLWQPTTDDHWCWRYIKRSPRPSEVLRDAPELAGR